MFKLLLAFLLAINVSLVYAQEDEPHFSCGTRALIYEEVVKLREEKKYSEIDVLRGLAKYLYLRNTPLDEAKEIVTEAQRAYEDRSLTSKNVFLFYLKKCPGDEV